MKQLLQSRRVRIVLIVILAFILVALYFGYETVNAMDPVLDRLASMPLADRWSSPDMLRIRQQGDAAIPSLRRVLREKDTFITRALFWVEKTWPAVTKYYSHLPDSNKMSERRWTACQVLQTLGPAAKPAVPDLVKVMETDRDVNAAAMALFAAGIDANTCELLDESLEKGRFGFGRVSAIMLLGEMKPPSARTLKILAKELTDSMPYVPKHAADALGRLGVPDSAAIDGLTKLQRSMPDDLTAVTCAAALWQLQKDKEAATTNVFSILERLSQNPIPSPHGGGEGGQGVNEIEEAFLNGGKLFQQIPLTEAEKARALGVMTVFCDKSGRIFIRMLLLPAMMGLGLDREKCLEVCRAGLQQNEDYYRLQAAKLLVDVAERFPTNQVDVDSLIHDKELGVRVYSARIHWRNHKDPEAVVPIFTDALDRKKYQSYYYPETVRAALRELGKIGSRAQSARTNVAALANDPDPQIAQLAIDTLNKIGK